MKAIVDRFEQCFVVVELEDGTISIDAVRTETLQKEIDALADDLFEDE